MALSVPMTPSINGQYNDQSNKWKRFGLLMVDAYQSLKNKFAMSEEQRKKSTEICNELKAQNDKLKQLLSYRESDQEVIHKYK